MKHIGAHVSAAGQGTNLGQGNIGLEAFTTLMRDTRLAGIPMILETSDPSLWPEEISWLRTQQHSNTLDTLHG